VHLVYRSHVSKRETADAPRVLLLARSFVRHPQDPSPCLESACPESTFRVVVEQPSVTMIMPNQAYPSIEGNDLMVLETPLLRVSRPVAACSRCRAAKVKCDGKLPACTACEKSNRASECSSTNDQFARGKERSYVATLEARVERLEKKISESRNRRKSSTVLMLDSPETSTPRRTSVDTLKAPRPISKRAARRKEASQIDELVSDFGLL